MIYSIQNGMAVTNTRSNLMIDRLTDKHRLTDRQTFTTMYV